MKDITVSEIKEITRAANNAIEFVKSRFPYIDSYQTLNALILEAAEKGDCSISFDYIDGGLNKTETLAKIEKDNNRIYESVKGGYAIHGVYDYPNYLYARGFNVEIRKTLKQHGYISKSYYISW